MKQHITREQLNEVLRPQSSTDIETSTSRAGSLRAWLNGKQPDDITIGRMIEFLDEKLAKEETDFNIRIHSAGLGWQRPGERLTDLGILFGSEIEDEVELCDALWEACKEVLESK